MQIFIGTTAIALPLPSFGVPTIQNLGPGVLYFDSNDRVLPQTGIRIEVGAIYTVRTTDKNTDSRGYGRGRDMGTGPVFLISDTPDTDVRFFT